MRSVSPPPGGKIIGTHISLIGFGFESIDLHWKGPVDEVRWLVVDVLHLDDHPLVVRVCIKADMSFKLEKLSEWSDP